MTETPANLSSKRRSWLGWLGCTGGIILWLFLMILPFLIFRLVTNGQLAIGDDPQNQARVFVLQEPGSEGIGLQWTRTRDEAAQCLDTGIYYLMFSVEVENARSCVCMGDLEGRSPPNGCTVP